MAVSIASRSTALLFADLAVEELLPEGLTDTDITAMTHDRAGGIWLGTRTGYVIRAEPGRGLSALLPARR